MKLLFRRLLTGTATFAALFLSATAISAQEDASRPKPAAREYPPLMGGSDGEDLNVEQESTANLNPDTHPLTGVQNATLGMPGIRHSYWLSGLQYGNIVRSNSLNQPTSSGWNTTSYAVGNWSLVEAWSRAQLAVNYSGGGNFSSDPAQGNSYLHQFGLVQTFDWGRWQLSFIDQFSYLPETQFGFGGGTGLAVPGVGGSLAPPPPGLQNNYTSDQTIFTTFGPRYSNAFATQVVYGLSPRGSVTVAGSFGILRFTEVGNIDTNQASFTAGYNYALTSEDTLGIQYRFGGYRFIGNPQAIDDHTAQLMYGRKITGRLALRIFGGPEVTTLRLSVGTSTNRVSASGGANLTYGLNHGSLSLSCSHGLSGGSGVFTGANTDQLQFNFDRRLSREWTSDWSFGYARNGAVNSLPFSQLYNSFYVGGNLSRPLGRNANFTIGYTAQIQTSNQPVCAAGTCSTEFTVHQIMLGLQWHTRPFVLR